MLSTKNSAGHVHARTQTFWEVLYTQYFEWNILCSDINKIIICRTCTSSHCMHACETDPGTVLVQLSTSSTCTCTGNKCRHFQHIRRRWVLMSECTKRDRPMIPNDLDMIRMQSKSHLLIFRWIIDDTSANRNNRVITTLVLRSNRSNKAIDDKLQTQIIQ